MRDVYVVGCLGNAALQAVCFNPCYWSAVCAAERSKRTLASGLPITRAPDLRYAAEQHRALATGQDTATNERGFYSHICSTVNKNQVVQRANFRFIYGAIFGPFAICIQESQTAGQYTIYSPTRAVWSTTASSG